MLRISSQQASRLPQLRFKVENCRMKDCLKAQAGDAAEQRQVAFEVQIMALDHNQE
jgi:hypothetical protein